MGNPLVCVILDLTMPRRDGVSALRELRRGDSDVRVILSSGYAEPEATAPFRDLGSKGFIQKPYRMVELKMAIERALV